MRPPSFKQEKKLAASGFSLIAGIDEAGSGAWAGPVFAGAVILPWNSRIGLLRDSKLLSPAQRELVAALIRKKAVAWAVGSASVKEIAVLNIRHAGLLAMCRAVEKLVPQPQAVIADAFCPAGLKIPCYPVIHGDRLVKSVAAASVLAKVARDALMRELAQKFPHYGFDKHKGYGTATHHAALKKYGSCVIHRMNYAPLQRIEGDLYEKIF